MGMATMLVTRNVDHSRRDVFRWLGLDVVSVDFLIDASLRILYLSQ